MPKTSTERVRAHRARQRAVLTAVPEDQDRDPDDLLGPAVEATIAALNLKPEDAAVAKLAEVLAATMDQAKSQEWAARWLGPHLLQVLGELGATPMTRGKLSRPSAPRPPSWLDELRASRPRL